MSGKAQDWDFSGLKAVFFNGTLKPSPAVSNTQGLMDVSIKIMQKHGVDVKVFRTVDEDIAIGVDPDMRKLGAKTDAWPQIYKDFVVPANILVICGPIWLGDNSSMTKHIIERLYANSPDQNSEGQYLNYGKVGGALITGNEDGVKHCAMNVLYSLQHIGCVIPPGADAGWIGPVGPGPSYLEKGSGGPESDFTNRNTTFMTWNLMHLAKMLKGAGGIPAYGNQRAKWDTGARFDFENSEYR